MQLKMKIKIMLKKKESSLNTFSFVQSLISKSAHVLRKINFKTFFVVILFILIIKKKKKIIQIKNLQIFDHLKDFKSKFDLLLFISISVCKIL